MIVRHRRSIFFLLRFVGDHRFGSNHQTSDRSGVLQRDAHDLGRIDDSSFDEILVLLGRGVETERAFAVPNFIENYRALGTGVGRRSNGAALRALSE